MTTSSKFSSYWTNGFRQDGLWEFPKGTYVKLSSAVVAILVGGLKCRTKFWKGITQGSFQQSLVEIGWVVSEENIIFLISSSLFSIFSLAAILVGSQDHQKQVWKRAIQGPFHQSLVAIGPVVSEERILIWISHRVLCYAKFGCWGHLGRRAGHIFGREPSNDYFIKI
jgi:hypothetical protein